MSCLGRTFSVCVYNVVTNNNDIFVTTLYRILYILNLLKIYVFIKLKYYITYMFNRF